MTGVPERSATTINIQILPKFIVSQLQKILGLNVIILISLSWSPKGIGNRHGNERERLQGVFPAVCRQATSLLQGCGWAHNSPHSQLWSLQRHQRSLSPSSRTGSSLRGSHCSKAQKNQKGGCRQSAKLLPSLPKIDLCILSLRFCPVTSVLP